MIEPKNILRRFLSLFLIIFFSAYKATLSPLFPHTCQFEPTCSEYFREAVLAYGIIKGTKLGVKRVLRCRGSYFITKDPLPKSL